LDAAGLPIGLHLVAPMDGEPQIFRVAAALERLYPIRLPGLD
jgi:Asp-tRNA(Asn)/Glu-tRNA(Gln) amidotransferase A subunit family amidase